MLLRGRKTALALCRERGRRVEHSSKATVESEKLVCISQIGQGRLSE